MAELVDALDSKPSVFRRESSSLSIPTEFGGVAELVDALVLGTSAFVRVGSSPTTLTNLVRGSVGMDAGLSHRRSGFDFPYVLRLLQ